MTFAFGEDSAGPRGDVAARSLLPDSPEWLEPGASADLVALRSAPGATLVVGDDDDWVWYHSWPMDQVPEEIRLTADSGRCPGS